MFEAWETFYLIVGTAGAALVGVMFIVSTLTAELEYDRFNRGTATYVTPTVAHFAAVLAVGALASIPSISPGMIGTLIALVGAIGLGFAWYTTRGMLAPDDFYQATTLDKLFFGALPAVLCLALVVGGAALPFGSEAGAEIIGVTTLLLLLLGIRNAWDVAIFAVRIGRTRRAADQENASGE